MRIKIFPGNRLDSHDHKFHMKRKFPPTHKESFFVSQNLCKNIIPFI